MYTIKKKKTYKNLFTVVLFVLFQCVSIGVVLSFEESISAEPVLVDWIFEPEIQTNAGFNIDAKTYGLLGTAKMDLTSDIYTKSDKEFKGKGDFYGVIIIKDFKVRVFVDDASDNYNSTTENTSPLKISWGVFEGKIYTGPVYFILTHTKQDEITYIETLDDEDLEFSSIGYSIIPAFYTGSYSGFKETGISSTDTDASTTDGINNAFGLDIANSGAFAMGMDLPETINVELGASMGYTYKQSIPTNYNPFALSLKTDVYALNRLVKNMSAKVHVSVVGGASSRSMFDESNPLTGGIIIGYSLPLLGMTFTPKVASEAQMFYMNKYKDKNISEAFIGQKKAFFVPFEVALGVGLDWKELGTSIESGKDDYLDFANRDIKVEDGVTIGGVYGHSYHKNFRDFTIPYIGGKLSFWESENIEENRFGKIKNLQVGLVFNANYAFGANMSKSNLTSLISKRSINYQPRLDLGVGAEASYRVSYFKPYMGMLYKLFNVLEAGATITTDSIENGIITTKKVSTNAYENRGDLRAKVGVDVERVVTNVIFTVEWQSGDMINDQEATVSRDLNGYQFFENNVSETDNSVMNLNTLARWGFVSIGATIRY